MPSEPPENEKRLLQSAAPQAARRDRTAAELRAEERKARAAAKLRENLLRRKTQARARRAGDMDDTIGLPAAKKDESGE